MLRTVEFKVQQSDCSWEDAEVTWIQLYDNPQQPQVAAKAMANLSGRQVRWNWMYSLQGHYAHPDHIVAISL